MHSARGTQFPVRDDTSGNGNHRCEPVWHRTEGGMMELETVIMISVNSSGTIAYLSIVIMISEQKHEVII